MKFIITSLLIMMTAAAWAAPDHIEVWLISQSKTASLDSLVGPKVKQGPLTAELQCQQMGDYCFDPQVGLYKKGDFGAPVDSAKVLDDSEKGIDHARSLDRDLINCDKNNYFDIFCGKARAEKTVTKSKLEVWIDTSSSMKEFDYTDKEGNCYRKSMMKRLDSSCSFNRDVNVMMFDTSIKQAGTMDSLCQNRGLNDQKRLIDWIERSEAKNLIIITDIYELHKEFADYISSKNGTVIGDKDPLTADKLLDRVNDLAKLCR